MKGAVKDIVLKIIRPSTTSLIAISLFSLFIIFFGDGKEPAGQKLFHFLSFFYNSELFAYIGIISIILLIARLIDGVGLNIKSGEWFENRKRVKRGWVTLEEEGVLESLFYIGIEFDELYKFVHWAYDVSFIAFTENSQSTTQNHALLARHDEDKYWLSYFRFSSRESGRIKILYMLISNFMEVLTGSEEYKIELREQSRQDPELKNIDTSKLLIAIINKDEIKRHLSLCEKYYKMIIDKRIEKKHIL